MITRGSPRRGRSTQVKDQAKTHCQKDLRGRCDLERAPGVPTGRKVTQASFPDGIREGQIVLNTVKREEYSILALAIPGSDVECELLRLDNRERSGCGPTNE
jgi:hypothetical protein